MTIESNYLLDLRYVGWVFALISALATLLFYSIQMSHPRHSLCTAAADCGIGSAGVHSIAQCLKTNGVLKHVDLSSMLVAVHALRCTYSHAGYFVWLTYSEWLCNLCCVFICGYLLSLCMFWAYNPGRFLRRLSVFCFFFVKKRPLKNAPVAEIRNLPQKNFSAPSAPGVPKMTIFARWRHFCPKIRAMTSSKREFLGDDVIILGIAREIVMTSSKLGIARFAREIRNSLNLHFWLPIYRRLAVFFFHLKNALIQPGCQFFFILVLRKK